jgi:Kef-type K+ transport system membrane component KefB
LSALPIAAIEVDTGSFFAIVVVAAVAAITVAVAPKRFAPPVVVLELMLGIVIGPQLLGLAHSDEFIEFFSNLGLGMLFFFAGYEIDFQRIKGKPMKLGGLGWLLSIALAYGIGGLLAAAGIVLSFLYTGSAMATTAIGTLIPILRDNGELKTRFGTYLLAAGGAGEFGPILLVTLVLSTANPLHESVILLGFIVLALVLALLSVRYAWRGWPALERTFESSSQLAVRVTVVLVFGLVLLAGKLGLDILLGGFVAGMIVRVALQGHELQVFESKLTAVGFGFFVPFFFVTSGIEFDLDALGSLGALAKLAMFLVLFLVVRGAPAMLLYRGVFSARDRAALAFYSATELPLVVAITTIATETGHMRTSTAAGLVGAAMLSTLVFPFVGLALRKGSAEGTEREAGPPGEGPSPLGEEPIAQPGPAA